MEEQANATIYLSSNPALALGKITAWRNSAAAVWLHVPYYAASLTLKVGNAAATEYSRSIGATYHPERGMWRAVIPAECLQFAAKTYYKVETVDADGARSVAGEGVLNVLAGKISDPADEAQPGVGG